MSVRVLIADDQPLMRTALRISLEAEADCHVVGEARDGLEAVELALAECPDVILMDLRMPGMDGITATRAVRTSCLPVVRVLILTTFDLDSYVVEALRAGASGFLLKDATADELTTAVRVVARGDAVLGPTVTRRLLEQYAQRFPLPASDPVEGLEQLTAREVQVLELVARGLSNCQIGDSLHVAPSSAKTHVSHLLTKLGRTDRVQLVVFAYESGLVHAGSI